MDNARMTRLKKLKNKNEVDNPATLNDLVVLFTPFAIFVLLIYDITWLMDSEMAIVFAVTSSCSAIGILKVMNHRRQKKTNRVFNREYAQMIKFRRAIFSISLLLIASTSFASEHITMLVGLFAILQFGFLTVYSVALRIYWEGILNSNQHIGKSLKRLSTSFFMPNTQ
ncbi:hypothetical protein [Geomicrobium sp. JCM 19039]|uniref:hypothetical protein n=1 Tax=Geomicrobium sp. JCM 19039 TaxID=1460636 RepID=UPI0005A79485|nr:hypothetical protein [Geomicrobium sp. JCM 19039]